MPSDFEPFLQSSGKGKASSTTASVTNVATDSAATGGSFAGLAGKAVSPAAASAHAAQPFSALCAHTPGTDAKPSISLQKDGDRITHIRVQCGCGQVVELECAY